MATIKIGVVEDELIIATTIVSALRKLKYEVAKPASNFNRALVMLEQAQPDIVLLDINLGGIKDGIDLAHFVRANYAIPIVFLTANSDPKTIERAKEVKPNAYLLKPFTQNDLYSAVEIALSNFQQVSAENRNPKNSIVVKIGYDYVTLKFSDLVYLEIRSNYLEIMLFNGELIIIRSTLNDMLALLPAEQFSRITRSIIINHAFILKIERDEVVTKERTFIVSARAKGELVKKLKW